MVGAIAASKMPMAFSPCSTKRRTRVKASSRSRAASALLNSKMTPARESGTSSRTSSTVTRGAAILAVGILPAGLDSAGETPTGPTGWKPALQYVSIFSSSLSICRVSPPVSKTKSSSASSLNSSFRFFAYRRTISLAASSHPARPESSRSKTCNSARLISVL